MNRRLIFNLTGAVLLVESAMMMISFVLSLALHSGDHWPLLLSAGITLAFGGGFRLIHPATDYLRARDGFAVVALTWVLVSIFGALPFFLSGVTPNFFDAVFEAASGFTTTGATIFIDVESVPKGLLFWRSFTHWAGGMGVLVLSAGGDSNAPDGFLHHSPDAGRKPPAPPSAKLVPQAWCNTARSAVPDLSWCMSVIHVHPCCCAGGLVCVRQPLCIPSAPPAPAGSRHYDRQRGRGTPPYGADGSPACSCMFFGVNFALYFLSLIPPVAARPSGPTAVWKLILWRDCLRPSGHDRPGTSSPQCGRDLWHQAMTDWPLSRWPPSSPPPATPPRISISGPSFPG